MIVNEKAVIALTPNEDHSAKEGYLVTLSGTVGTLVTAGAAATAKPIGVIITGYPTGTLKDDIATHKFAGIVKVATAATPGSIVAGSLLALDGTTGGAVKLDPGTGARVVVGQALEDVGTGGDLINALLSAPIVYAA